MAGRDTTAAMEAFVERYSLGSFPHAVDEDGSLWNRFGVAYQPAWVFVGADGRADVVPGSLPEDALVERLERLGGP